MSKGPRCVAARAAWVLLAMVPVLGGSGCVLPFASFKIEKKSDILYVTGFGADPSAHRLDIYKPLGNVSNAPVVLFVHGGSWKVGDKARNQNIGTTLAQNGIVCVSINYRLAPGNKHPAQVRDVAQAFHWVKKNIVQYGGSPDHVFLWGQSAGGHLVSLLALNRRYLAEVAHTPDEICGVISMSGVYVVGTLPPFFNGVFNADDVIDASPLNHVGRRNPPFLIFYMDADFPTLGGQARNFFAKLRQNRSPATLLRVPFRTHITALWLVGTPGDPVTKAILEFVREHSQDGPARLPVGGAKPGMGAGLS